MLETMEYSKYDKTAKKNIIKMVTIRKLLKVNLASLSLKFQEVEIMNFNVTVQSDKIRNKCYFRKKIVQKVAKKSKNSQKIYTFN